MQKIGIGVAIVGVLIICVPFFRFGGVGMITTLVGLSLIGVGFVVVVRSPPSSDEKDELWSQKKTGK